MSNQILPNTFLIGAQKSATTSVYRWIAQHPDVLGPNFVKDFPFFFDDSIFTKGLDYLSSLYENEYNGEKVVLQGNVHYIFYEKALKNISEFNPDAKFILIIRNPIERAMSAHKFAIKMQWESLDFKEAVEAETSRMASNELKTLSELTYLNHGLYHKQIENFLKYFKKEQLKVIVYDDLEKDTAKVVDDLFGFLGVQTDFVPEFKVANVTGELRSKAVQSFFYKDSIAKTIFFDNKVVDTIFPERFRKKVWSIISVLNTKKPQKKVDYLAELDSRTKERLKAYFKDDIAGLQAFLNRDLSIWMK